MSRPLKVLLVTSALAMLAALIAACGTERIKVPTSDAMLHRGALLFSERCSGCHTLSYAATQGSAANVRTAEITNGPNLDQRCERPVTRVLYAIENGGFSGAIMPQNVVVGKDASDVAQFVSRYAGTKAAKSPGVPNCDSQSIGTLPPPTATTATAKTTATKTTKPTSTKRSGAPRKRKKHKKRRG